MSLKELPQDIQPLVNKIRRKILKEYLDTRALFVIGSMSDWSYGPDSDIDIVWIKIRKIKVKRLLELEEKLNYNIELRRIQLVPFTYKELSWHFNNSSTMAHSIQKGIIIYGARNRSIQKFLAKKLSLPKKEWMYYWLSHWLKKYEWARFSIRRERRFHKRFCKDRCHCSIFDDIARVAVNFGILYLETNGIVPISKRQIISNFQRSDFRLPEDLLKG